MATADLNHSSSDMFCPLISKDKKKVYVLGILSNAQHEYMNHAPNQKFYLVKLGNLEAELAKAGLS